MIAPPFDASTCNTPHHDGIDGVHPRTHAVHRRTWRECGAIIERQ